MPDSKQLVDSQGETTKALRNFFLAVFGGLLFICILLIIYNYKKQNGRSVVSLNPISFNQQNQQNRGRGQRRKQQQNSKYLTQEEIEKYMPMVFLKDIAFETPGKLDDFQNCAVCLVDFDQNTYVRQALCKHIFCHLCLESWLQKHENCPLCRFDLSRKRLEQLQKEKKLSINNQIRINQQLPKYSSSSQMQYSMHSQVDLIQNQNQLNIDNNSRSIIIYNQKNANQDQSETIQPQNNQLQNEIDQFVQNQGQYNQGFDVINNPMDDNFNNNMMNNQLQQIQSQNLLQMQQVQIGNRQDNSGNRQQAQNNRVQNNYQNNSSHNNNVDNQFQVNIEQNQGFQQNQGQQQQYFEHQQQQNNDNYNYNDFQDNVINNNENSVYQYPSEVQSQHNGSNINSQCYQNQN